MLSYWVGIETGPRQVTSGRGSNNKSTRGAMTTATVAFAGLPGMGLSVLLAAILCLAHLGCSTANSGVGRPAKGRSLTEATTRPAAGDAEALTEPTTRAQATETQTHKRLTGLRWVLLGLQQKYLAEEGINHRAKRFEKLVNAVGVIYTQEPPLSEIEMLDLLGAPDYGVFDEEGGEYAYLYSRSGEKDSAVHIHVSSSGFVDRVSYAVAKPEYYATAPKLQLWPEQKFPGLKPRPGRGGPSSSAVLPASRPSGK